MFMVVYRPHGALNCETAFIGPFVDSEAATKYVSKLPALGNPIPERNTGVKYVAAMTHPEGFDIQAYMAEIGESDDV